jgi:hypothetical protein
LIEMDSGTAWEALADGDTTRSYRAIDHLVSHPNEAIPLLRQRLAPAVVSKEKDPLPWVLALDADDFEERERAEQQLVALGEGARPALERALKGQPNPEVKRRIPGILERIATTVPPPEELRAVRSIEALERIGTPAALEILQEMATGAPDALPTREARVSLDRLRTRR